ncbi:WD40-repeat-containing domain protein [Chlamydoabsidia padenii]|nr:WD40-repeat-containing domain protein [Chlamydoabsidia padenii]
MPPSKDNSFLRHTSLLRYFKRSSWRDRLKPSSPTTMYYTIPRIDEGFHQTPNNKVLSPLSSTTLLSCDQQTSCLHLLASTSSLGSTRTTIDFLTDLPIELARLILVQCDPDTLVVASYVSRYWYLLCNDTQLWKAIYEERYGSRAQHNDDFKRLYQSTTLLEHRWRHGKHDTQCIHGHSDSIYCVQFDKTKIVTGSRDQTIKFWTMESGGKKGKCIRTLVGHHASVLCLQYNDDWLVSGSSDHSVLVWSMHTFQVIWRLTGHNSGVLDVSFDHEYVASCSKDTTIRLWDITTGQHLRTLRGHRGPVNAMQFKDHQLVSASGDSTIRLWDMKTGQCIRDFVGHSRGLACIRFDGSVIISGSNDNTIRIWDAHSGVCTMTLEGHSGLVRALDFDHHKIVSGSYDESIRVWDRLTGACLVNYPKCHSSWVFDVMFDDTKIISTSQDQKILIMDFGYGIDTHLYPDGSST